MGLGFVEVEPVRFDGVGVYAGADVELVADDDEGDVSVVGGRLKRILPLDESFVAVAAGHVVN